MYEIPCYILFHFCPICIYNFNNYIIYFIWNCGWLVYVGYLIQIRIQTTILNLIMVLWRDGLINSQKMHREKKLDWLVWRLTISIGSHYMYFKDISSKVSFQTKSWNNGRWKYWKRTLNISNDDVLQLTFSDNWWIVKSHTHTILSQWYCFRGNPFVDYAGYYCKHPLRSNFYKYHIAIIIRILPDSRESSILEYCGTYNDIQRRGLEALCLYS